ncbi:MucBP domain-containing protein, partial [Aerococcus loyolae]
YIYEKVQEEKGSFQEHHIYRTVDKNGNILSTDEVSDGETSEGKSSDQYTTSKKDKPGYKLVKVEAKNGGQFDKNGAETKANYVDNTKQEVTYIYEKVQEEAPVEKKGSFQEHHIYRTVDEEGNVISTEERKDNEVTTGKSDQSYTTSKQEKDGYKLVSVTPSTEESKKSGVKFSKDGQETKGNYISDKKLEVTYVYERVQKTKGSFQEHHIYRTVDEDGNVLSTDETKDNEVSSGKTDQKYTTSKQDKGGYKLVSVTPSNEDSKKFGVKFSKEGQETKGNFVSNKKLEVTYIYERVQKTKGSFQEHHIYRTVDKNGNVLSTDEVTDGVISEGKSSDQYTTSKKDKSDYTLVKIETKNGGQFDKNGAETRANYVENTKQEVTYIYEKVQEEPPVEEQGTFQEHHIYQTVDEEGKVVSVDELVNIPETSGKSTDQYITSKKDRPGYRLVKVEAKNGAHFDKAGKSTQGQYIENIKQEVTYIYVKLQDIKKSVQEHNSRQTNDKVKKVDSVDKVVEVLPETSKKISTQYTPAKGSEKDGDASFDNPSEYTKLATTPTNASSSLPKTGSIGSSSLTSVFGLALTLVGVRVFKKRKI